MAAQDYEQLSYNGPAGCQIGSGASELVGFHGAVPVSQASFVASITATFLDGSVSASAFVGFSRGTMSNALTLLNSIEALLIAKGLMAAS